jgi:hypothetical protein
VEEAEALLALLAKLFAALEALLEMELRSELKVELAPAARELPPAVADETNDEACERRELPMEEPSEIREESTLLVGDATGEVVMVAAELACWAAAPLARAMAKRSD